MKRLFLIILISLDVLLCGLIVFNLKELTLGSSQTAKWEKKEQELGELIVRIKAFDEKKILAEHRRFFQRVPQNTPVPLPAMKALRSIADGLTIKEIRFSFEERQVYTLPGIDNLKVIPFKVSLKGTYESLVLFIGEISSAEVLMTASKVKMQSSPEVPLVEADLVVQTFTTLGSK